MRILRVLLVAASAAALGSALVISAVSGSPSAAPAAHRTDARTHLTAKFLAEARAAFLKDLRTPDTALLVPGTPRPSEVRNSTAAGSYNWAGYADVSTTDGTFTAVSGSWTVPAVTCTKEDRATSVWVGLDGFNNGTVEQDGTASQCFQGVAVYYDWYEMYPAGTVEVASVSAGDSISASVTRSGASYTLAVTDSTNSGASFSDAASCSTSTCLDTSAEWITERPAYGTTGIIPEAQFKTAVKFTSASETANGTTSTISGFSGTNYKITCVDSTDTYDIVSTSGLTGGNSFTNTWKDSY